MMPEFAHVRVALLLIRRSSTGALHWGQGDLFMHKH